jgi:hypothetical protein
MLFLTQFVRRFQLWPFLFLLFAAAAAPDDVVEGLEGLPVEVAADHEVGIGLELLFNQLIVANNWYRQWVWAIFIRVTFLMSFAWCRLRSADSWLSPALK